MVYNCVVTKFHLIGSVISPCCQFNELKAFIISKLQNKYFELHRYCFYSVAGYFGIEYIRYLCMQLSAVFDEH